MSQIGIFCTVARTELVEGDYGEISDETLHYLNHAITQAYNLGLARAIEVLKNSQDLEMLRKELV